MAILKPTPSTTESATNRIDLVRYCLHALSVMPREDRAVYIHEQYEDHLRSALTAPTPARSHDDAESKSNG